MNYYDTIIAVLNKWYRGFAEATPRLAVGIIIFLLFLTFSSFLSKVSVKVFHKLFPKSKNNSIVTLIKVFKFLIILSGAFIALEIMGMGGFVLKFIGSLGVAGVVAGVALKDLVSSMFSGALVGIDKSFAHGDYVSIKDVTGVVEKIGFLTTKIITDEGKKVFVPNQLIFSAPFTNYSASGQRKVFLKLQLASDQDLDRASTVILETVKTFDFADHVDDAEVIILKQNFAVFFLEARFFMKSGENIMQVRSKALLLIKNELQNAGIELATQSHINISE